MDSLVILDRKGIIQWASPTIFALLGYQPEELQGIEIFKISKALSTRTKHLYVQVQEHPTKVNEGLRQFQAKNGVTIPLYITVSGLPGSSLPGLVLLHLQMFARDDQRSFSILYDKAEIELALHKKTEHEIAAELHDHINPNLVGAKLLLDFALKDTAQHLEQLKKTSAIIGEMIHEIRNLSHNIVQNAERDFELKEALSSLLENFNQGSFVRIVLRYDRRLEKIFTNNQKVHVVRIIQEQLLNIVKHASATKILVSIQQANEKITIITKDNGRGFDPSRQRNGIGLSNMLARVNELGGNMHINSKCNEGTSIRIVFPVKATMIPNPG